jgi:hypothetical protein
MIHVFAAGTPALVLRKVGYNPVKAEGDIKQETPRQGIDEAVEMVLFCGQGPTALHNVAVAAFGVFVFVFRFIVSRRVLSVCFLQGKGDGFLLSWLQKLRTKRQQ